MVKLYLELPPQTEKAKEDFEEIFHSIYRGKGVGNVTHAEDYRCNCKYRVGRDNIDKACGETAGCVNRELYIECIEGDCPCGQYCQNRRFQKAENSNVDVIYLPLKGYGIRATGPLKKNQFIMEYLGEVIKYDVFQKRMRRYNEEGLQHFYFMSLQAGEIIDATDKGCIARFMNHSCAPNCYIQKWMVGEKYRIGIFTLRDIENGEELTFDYNADRYGSEAQACHCGEPQCRGIIGGTRETSNNIRSQETTQANLSKPIESVDDVLQFIGLMLKSVEKPEMVPGLLNRLQMTNDEPILKMFMKLHGSIMLKTYIREHQDQPEILMKSLEIAGRLPYKYQNRRVESSHLKEWVERTSSREDDVGKMCKVVLEKWNNLPEYYKIPKYSERGLEPPNFVKPVDPDSLNATKGVKKATDIKKTINVTDTSDTESSTEKEKGKEIEVSKDEPEEKVESVPEYEYYNYECSHDYYVRFADSHFPFQHMSQLDYWTNQGLGPYKSFRNDRSDRSDGEPGSSKYWRNRNYRYNNGHQRSSQPAPPPPKEPELPPLAPNWFEAKDEYGHTYYYNKYTKETSWERPVVKDDMKTIDGFSKAEIQGVIERAEALAKKAEKERERALREKQESMKVGSDQTLGATGLSESDFKSSIKLIVIDYCSRFKRHVDVPTFKKMARDCAHIVVEKELRRSEWVGKDTFTLSEDTKSRIKNFTIERMKRIVAQMKFETESNKSHPEVESSSSAAKRKRTDDGEEDRDRDEKRLRHENSSSSHKPNGQKPTDEERGLKRKRDSDDDNGRNRKVAKQ
ncbi:10741_t:CDS:2 [Diversispora eburnea]|uniref:[histone H3]-lysine(36) N-trimethyltransferase n=2 Tax=Diversisporales TaxID=214509 RepID=A0A9N8ZG16_9GLOM|nr:10741_t:CDS:2 [Diversispora eburnea]